MLKYIKSKKENKIKKLITGLALLSVLSTSGLAKMPQYKTSMGVEVGMVDMGDLDKNEPTAGLFFKMENKLGKGFYGGFGLEYEYTQAAISGIDIQMDSINLYPTISYNFSRKLSLNSFLGYSYSKINLNHEEDIAYALTTYLGFSNSTVKSTVSEIQEPEFLMVYGLGVDYAVGAGVTHGLAYKKYETNKLGIDLSSLTYRIGLRF